MAMTHDFAQPKESMDTTKTILVVEDDEGTRELLELALTEGTPYYVVSMATGSDALDNIEGIVEMKPVVFIIDYTLPRLTGICVYDQLHAAEGLKHVPALLLTAQDTYIVSQQLVERQMELFAKPFDLDELLQCIERVIAQSNDNKTAIQAEKL